MSDTAVVWFRSDLRVHDNPTLAAAVDEFDEVVPLYVVDPAAYGEGMFGLPKTGPHRARFRRESLVDLRERLQERGGELVVREGAPADVVPEVAAATDAEAVHFQTMPSTEEQNTENAVRSALPEGVAAVSHWTHTLYHLDDLPTPPAGIPDTFTPWRKDVEGEGEVRETVPTPDSVPVPHIEAGEIPTLAELGVDRVEPDERGVLPFEGGETRALERVREYVWDRDHLREYKETRNGLLGADYSSKFSPWLAQGCLSPRRVHAEVQRYEQERVSNESTYWLVFELLWRDYWQFQFRKHGPQFFQQGGIRERDDIDWSGTDEQFERWAAGETGVPFVDANMRELNRTGYLSNRGRQNVASFLANTLRVDWRKGAAYFEAMLVDYDVCSNWGNWAYNAQVGNDSRDNYFDVVGQAGYYDNEAEYVKHWLPELADLPPEYAHEPWTMSEQEQGQYGVALGADYPRPVVEMDHAHDHL